jgi:transcriptional regulator with XRE-family HTH domain
MAKLEVIFGQVIRRRREKTGISQEAFAAKAGIHRTYASAVERGVVQVSIGVAMKLATALDTPLSRIWKDVEDELS